MDRHREKQASLQKVETRRAELESWSRASDSAKVRSAAGNRGGGERSRKQAQTREGEGQQMLFGRRNSQTNP